MTRTFFGICLFLTGAAGKTFAQQTVIEVPYAQPSYSDVLFGTALFDQKKAQNKTSIVFDFRLASGNKAQLQLLDLAQADSLPNLELLLQKVRADLSLLSDSLSDPLTYKLVDFVVGRTENAIRIQTLNQKGNLYSIRSGKVTQLKVEQDTLRIQLRSSKQGKAGGPIWVEPYYLNFYLNHLSDLDSIDTRGLVSMIELMKSEIAKNAKKGNAVSGRYYAYYDVKLQKKIAPENGILTRYGYSKRIQLLPPYVQIGVQYVRGAWAPSAGVGLDLSVHQRPEEEKHFRLIWEPYFFFSRDGSNNLQMDRNDFVSFKYYNSSTFNSTTREVEFRQTVSIGYLVNCQGAWLEPHTVKFSLPGLQYKNVLLEPEFFSTTFSKISALL